MGRNSRSLASAVIILSAVLCLFMPSLSFGDSAEYIYDDTGRLRAVIDSSSNELIYNYDEVGNLLSITNRTVTGTIAITDFDPHEGSEGTVVTIYGKGFSATPANNIVKFNSLQASVPSQSTATKIIVTAPSGVTTGKITVTNSNGTATSVDDFVINVPPAAITVSPDSVFMFEGGLKQFKAYADGVETKKVKWSVEGIEGGNLAYGPITKYSGLYFAPSNLITDKVTITATSILDPSKSGTAMIYFYNSSIVTRPVSVSISSITGDTLMTSSLVSVGFGPLPLGTVLSSDLVSVAWPLSSGTPLTSNLVSVAWPSFTGGMITSMPVSVKIIPLLTVTINGAGIVTSNPAGIDCSTDCTEYYNNGTSVTLTAQADPCSTFAGWSGGGCSGTGTCTVNMNSDTTVTATFNAKAPTADFTGSPLSGPLPLTVNFTDLSTCAASWSWNFGDSSTNTLQNPSHIYSTGSGNYTVSLTVTGAGGPNTATKTNYITVISQNSPIRNARTNAIYTSIQEAYNAAESGDTIQTQATALTENVSFNISKTVILDGGYDSNYATVTGKTALTGNITVIDGTVAIGNFELNK